MSDSLYLTAFTVHLVAYNIFDWRYFGYQASINFTIIFMHSGLHRMSQKGYHPPTSHNIQNVKLHTADFIKKVLSVYTHSMATIFLSRSTQVAESTFFMKSPVL